MLRAGGAERPQGLQPAVPIRGVGMGKTHLMQAIGHEVRSTCPMRRFVLVDREVHQRDDQIVG